MQILEVDIMGPYPRTSKCKTNILVVTFLFTHQVEVFAVLRQQHLANSDCSTQKSVVDMAIPRPRFINRQIGHLSRAGVSERVENF